jgi:ribonuclease VapC
MFVDASALVAIIAEETDADILAAKLHSTPVSYTSPLAVYEAALGLARIRQTTAPAAVGLVSRLLAETRTETVPITGDVGAMAIEAFARFGRGNHPARLNMGDCFAYACACSLGVPLLFKRADFAQTDIPVA